MQYPCNGSPNRCNPAVTGYADNWTIQLVTVSFVVALACMGGFARYSVRRANFELFQLTHVEMLDLANNRLKELPAEVCMMTKLKKLYLDHNQLTRLPHELHKISNTLTLLGVAENPLDPELMQLYLAGLPLLLAHLKATRPRSAAMNSTSTSMARSNSGDISSFDLFTTALPPYPDIGLNLTQTSKSVRA